jgi:F-type H+-transporting ATPase subunit b
VRRAARLAAAAALAVALLALAGAARAQEEHEHAATAEHAGGEGAEAEHAPTFDAKKFGLQLLNFAVLAGVLGWFGGRAINRALLARHQQLKTDLAAAAETRAAAEAAFKKQEARLASLEQEIAGIRAGIKEEAEAEKARLIAAAEERAKRIQQETTFMLDQQIKEAQVQLQREAAEASVRVAEELLKRSIGGADQQRMVETFVNEVAGDGATRPSRPPAAPEGTPPPRPAPRSAF